MIFFEEVPGCIHNNMVECPASRRNCKSCGWNPEVSHARLQAFAKERPELAEELIQMGKLPAEEC